MINSLTIRIFAIFWITIALVLMLILMIPNLNLGQITPLLESEYHQGIFFKKHIEKELASQQIHDLMWWLRFSNTIHKSATTSQHFILVTNEGKVIGAMPNEMQLIRNLIEKSNNIEHPKKRKNMVMLRYQDHFD